MSDLAHVRTQYLPGCVCDGCEKRGNVLAVTNRNSASDEGVELCAQCLMDLFAELLRYSVGE